MKAYKWALRNDGVQELPSLETIQPSTQLVNANTKDKELKFADPSTFKVDPTHVPSSAL